MSKIAGSLRKAIIDGVTYDVVADANVSIMLSLFENDSIATSGSAIHKKTKRVAKAESIVLGTSWEDRAVLRDVAESLDTISFSLEFAGGDSVSAFGHIHIESDESEELRTTVIFLPDEGWTITAA